MKNACLMQIISLHKTFKKILCLLIKLNGREKNFQEKKTFFVSFLILKSSFLWKNEKKNQKNEL